MYPYQTLYALFNGTFVNLRCGIKTDVTLYTCYGVSALLINIVMNEIAKMPSYVLNLKQTLIR